MNKPMIMVLLEDLAQGGDHAIREATDLYDTQIQAALDELQLLDEGPGASAHASIERGRIFAGMSGLTSSPANQATSVITDLLNFVQEEASENAAILAMMAGYKDFVNEN